MSDARFMIGFVKHELCESDTHYPRFNTETTINKKITKHKTQITNKFTMTEIRNPISVLVIVAWSLRFI